jgi:hypothetical protein
LRSVVEKVVQERNQLNLNLKDMADKYMLVVKQMRHELMAVKTMAKGDIEETKQELKHQLVSQLQRALETRSTNNGILNFGTVFSQTTKDLETLKNQKAPSHYKFKTVHETVEPNSNRFTYEEVSKKSSEEIKKSQSVVGKSKSAKSITDRGSKASQPKLTLAACFSDVSVQKQ